MNAVRLGALCALLLTASLARAQVEIPDTPVGRNVSAMLEALNSRDRDVVARYVADYGRGESVDAVMRGISAGGLRRHSQWLAAREQADAGLAGRQS